VHQLNIRHRYVMVLDPLCFSALLLMPSGSGAWRLGSDLIALQTSAGEKNKVEVDGRELW
jgi:hypothetical protein